MALVPYLIAAGNVSPVVVSQSVPVTTAVPVGDSIVCFANTNTASTINTLADSGSNSYTRAGWSATSPTLAVFVCTKTTTALTTSSTFTLTNSATGVAAEEWIMVGMTTSGAGGGGSGPTNATSQNPVVSMIPGVPASWICAAVANTNGGGAPTLSSSEPFTIINKQQNGTNQVLTVACALSAAYQPSVTWNLVSSVANDVAMYAIPIPGILLSQQHDRRSLSTPTRPRHMAYAR